MLNDDGKNIIKMILLVDDSGQTSSKEYLVQQLIDTRICDYCTIQGPEEEIIPLKVMMRSTTTWPLL